MTKLRGFQKDFIRHVMDPTIDTAALSLPRGNGKSFLAGHVLSRCLTPGDRLNKPGAEYILGAASLEQARMTYQFIRAALEPSGEYRWNESTTRLGAVHKATHTRLRAISSNAKSSFGIVGVGMAVLDEPGALDAVGGTMLADSLLTAQGKPGSDLKVVMIGTLAPATGGWWHDLIADGSHHSTYVQALRGDPEKWDQWGEIRRCNPLTAISPSFRRKLLEERDAARLDTRLKARFLSYRLNSPTGDESVMLLTVSDWESMTGRNVPDRVGRPIVGCDLGGGRSWSAAVAVWQSGRVEALAVAPGVPGLEEQERRDRQPPGTYRRLADSGRLRVVEGKKVQPPSALWEMVCREWGQPVKIVCDRFRLAELEDAAGPAASIIEPRVARYSEASADIRALRKFAADGPFGVDEGSRLILAASLAQAQVTNDDQGSTRLTKKGSNSTARDDVAAALVLAAGAFDRAETTPPPRRARTYLV